MQGGLIILNQNFTETLNLLKLSFARSLKNEG